MLMENGYKTYVNKLKKTEKVIKKSKIVELS